MKYFLDTEFIEDGKTIDLISIGLVAEDGREYYAEFEECDYSKADEWVMKNVIAHLKGGEYHRPRKAIVDEILCFVDTAPEFWAYYADYDWVAFCQLFGRMIDLPKGFPYYCRDIKQLCDDVGNPRLPEQTSTEHHALEDARWNKLAFDFLMGLKAPVGT